MSSSLLRIVGFCGEGVPRRPISMRSERRSRGRAASRGLGARSAGTRRGLTSVLIHILPIVGAVQAGRSWVDGCGHRAFPPYLLLQLSERLGSALTATPVGQGVVPVAPSRAIPPDLRRPRRMPPSSGILVPLIDKRLHHAYSERNCIFGMALEIVRRHHRCHPTLTNVASCQHGVMVGT